MMNNFIQVDNLSFSYGTAKILESVSLALEQGEFAGIIGPNGSGKSTFLKNLGAVLTPSEGKILLAGRDPARLHRRELARLLAMVNQENNAGFNFRVKDVVAMGRYPYLNRFGTMRERDGRAVERAMHLTGCYHLQERELFSLSGGERQRVILARALAQETPILLLDEPTSFLDIGYQVELMELLQSLNLGESLTVITVMHDLNLASRYCRKLVLFQGGKIFTAGAPAEVLTRDNILQVYRTDVLIEPHPLGGGPQVIPISTGARVAPANGKPVHIIGGGGSATPVIKDLFARGLPVTAGVLSVGDEDWATARRLGLVMAEEAPFSMICEESHRENLQLIDGAGVVILAPLFVGPGNLANLDAARYALEKGITVIAIDTPPITERDFSGGKGKALFENLLKNGAVMITGSAGLNMAEILASL